MTHPTFTQVVWHPNSFGYQKPNNVAFPEGVEGGYETVGVWRGETTASRETSKIHATGNSLKKNLWSVCYVFDCVG